MTLIETLHEIAGQPLPPQLQMESVEHDEPLTEETGFELNEEDWVTLKSIKDETGTPDESVAKFLQEAGLIQAYRGVKSGGWQLTPAAVEWLGMLNDDHA